MRLWLCSATQNTKELAAVVAEWKQGDGEAIAIKLTPEMVLKILRRISDEDVAFMGFCPKWSRPDWMICQVLAVPPPAVRHPLNTMLSKEVRMT